DFNSLPAQNQILLCSGIPNNSTQTIVTTSRLFINLPKDIYATPSLQFTTTSGNATAGTISNAGPDGQAFQASDSCWSYYYEFDGIGEVDLAVKSSAAGQPDYSVKFMVVVNTGTTTGTGQTDGTSSGS